MTRTYVVTGTSSGIGLATRVRLEGRGARVIGVDLYDADVTADLGTPEGRAALVSGAREATGGSLDAVIACAGVSAAGATAETAARTAHAAAETALRVNFFGAVATLEGLRPLLSRGSKPRAAVVASAGLLAADKPEFVDACLDGDEEHAVAAISGVAPRDAYHISKRAIARWVRRAAPTADWAGAGIALNAVAPGVFDTPQGHGIISDPALRSATLELWPMPFGGPGLPEHVAALLDYLTGEDNHRVTGQVIFIDGGADAVRRGDDVW